MQGYFYRFYLFLKSSLKKVIGLALLLSLAACQHNVDGMLNPKGLIALEERKLFFDTLALMLIVVLPVVIMSLTFVYHYRFSQHKVRDYKPNWAHSHFLETIWWGIPCVIIVVLAVLTWKKTHELDPYTKVPTHHETPLIIQAIALPWKWLFIYPDKNVASLNYVEIPVNQQVEFWITADNVPMSALFIPQLGSQIYAMAGMRTKLFVVANEPGEFLGMNTMFNGGGFADMQFMVHAVPADQMQSWYESAEKSSLSLDHDTYKKLLASSINDKPQLYSHVENYFFQNVVNTYISSTGALHPREQQAKFQSMLNQEN